MGTQFAITLTVLILLVDFIMILLTFSLKVIRTHRNKHRVGIESKIEHQVTYEDVDLEIMPPDQLMEVYVKLRENLALPVSQQEHIMQVLLDGPLPQKFIKGLKSRFYIKRAESASKLKYLENKEIQEALLKALDTERHPVVILQLAYALATQHVTKAIKPIARKLRGMNTWFSRRLRAILYSYGFDFLKFAKRNRHNSRLYMQLLICGFAREYPSEELRPCMIERALSGNGYVRVLALLALIKYYPSELTKEPFISSTHRKTLSYVIRAYGKNLELSHVDAIMSYANFTTLREQIVLTLSEMAAKDPAILTEILRRFEQSKSKDKRALYAKVLANRVEYFLTRIHSPIEKQVENLIQELVRANHVSAMLFFLNRNQDPDIEKKLFTTLKRLSSRHKGLRAQMLMYLEPQVLKRCGLKDDKKGKETPRLHAEPPQRLQLAIIFISILVFIPLVIMASEFPKLIELGWSEIGRLYVTRFNYLLVFYSVTINIIYLVMLGISLWGAHVQSRLWALKGTQFLFTKNLLPSISIIAPAFNEAASIIESTNSLLNQRYPDFELIVVNDGSRDTTLKTLIDYYKLEKRDIQVKPRLKTRALRGIYMNRSIPNLIVVDKMNGGKADSLNMGLNVASKTFFCGIDADSLLEPEALLRAVSVMIDSKEESVAAGGNICPVNGCDVERGHLDTISLPKKFLPRLQSLEYIRAFMSGRVGWAQINCLLIISGAFGIFNRDRTIKNRWIPYQKRTVPEGHGGRRHGAGGANLTADAGAAHPLFGQLRLQCQLLDRGTGELEGLASPTRPLAQRIGRHPVVSSKNDCQSKIWPSWNGWDALLFPVRADWTLYRSPGIDHGICRGNHRCDEYPDSPAAFHHNHFSRNPGLCILGLYFRTRPGDVWSQGCPEVVENGRDGEFWHTPDHQPVAGDWIFQLHAEIKGLGSPGAQRF